MKPVACCCARNTDGSVTTLLCPVHAAVDPCETRAAVTGRRRKGSNRSGVCSACGHGGAVEEDDEDATYTLIVHQTVKYTVTINKDVGSPEAAALTLEDGDWDDSDGDIVESRVQVFDSHKTLLFDDQAEEAK